MHTNGALTCRQCVRVLVQGEEDTEEDTDDSNDNDSDNDDETYIPSTSAKASKTAITTSSTTARRTKAAAQQPVQQQQLNQMPLRSRAQPGGRLQRTISAPVYGSTYNNCDNDSMGCSTTTAATATTTTDVFTLPAAGAFTCGETVNNFSSSSSNQLSDRRRRSSVSSVASSTHRYSTSSNCSTSGGKSTASSTSCTPGLLASMQRMDLLEGETPMNNSNNNNNSKNSNDMSSLLAGCADTPSPISDTSLSAHQVASGDSAGYSTASNGVTGRQAQLNDSSDLTSSSHSQERVAPKHGARTRRHSTYPASDLMLAVSACALSSLVPADSSITEEFTLRKMRTADDSTTDTQHILGGKSASSRAAAANTTATASDQVLQQPARPLQLRGQRLNRRSVTCPSEMYMRSFNSHYSPSRHSPGQTQHSNNHGGNTSVTSPNDSDTTANNAAAAAAAAATEDSFDSAYNDNNQSNNLNNTSVNSDTMQQSPPMQMPSFAAYGHNGFSTAMSTSMQFDHTGNSGRDRPRNSFGSSLLPPTGISLSAGLETPQAKGGWGSRPDYGDWGLSVFIKQKSLTHLRGRLGTEAAVAHEEACNHNSNGKGNGNGYCNNTNNNMACTSQVCTDAHAV
jgi:hypothetical protein